MKQLAEITRDCLDLPSGQRLRLARILIDISEPVGEVHPPIRASWEDEIAARVEAVKNGSARSRLMREAFEELDEKYTS